VLYEMLCGVPPFFDLSFPRLFNTIRKGASDKVDDGFLLAA
jgi:hypothetical protein